jgi:tRNA(Ile)-lysidine synthetase-like protein
VAADVFARADTDENGVVLRGAADLPRAIARRVVRLSFRALGADASDTDVEAVLAGRRLRTKSIEAWCDGDISFVRDPLPAPDPIAVTSGVTCAPEWGLRLRVGNGDGPSWRWRCTLPASSVVIRARRAGDRVRTHGGTKKVQDVLIDAKIPRPLRALVPIACTDEAAHAVVGLTKTPDAGPFVLDAEPLEATWTKGAVWTLA